MNYSTAVMLFNPEIRAVSVSYDRDKDGNGIQIVLYKTLDKTISKGDMVVVPTDTRHNYTICRVEGVDVEVDYEADIQIKWVVGRVDLAAYNGILSEEGRMIDTMKAAEKRAKREEIKNKVQEFYKGEDLQNLALIGHSSIKAT